MLKTSMVAVVLLGVFSPVNVAWSQTLSYGPILGRGQTPDKMVVKWGTGAAADATSVSYRVKGTTAFTTVTGAASKDHELVLGGLGLDTQYDYYVQSGATKSATFGFATCPSASKPMDIVFYGDSRSGATEHQKIVNAVIAKAPEMVFESGDIYLTGAYSGYLSEFFPVAKDLVANVPFMAVPGNHDAGSTLATNYGLVFPSARNTGDAWKSYYTFTCGNAAFIGLDSNSITDPAQISFLTNQLSAAQADANVVHIFIWFHHAPYSVGATHGDTGAVQTSWVPLFEATPKVTAVFSGHDHIYARMQHGASNIAYIVSGGAGADLYGITGTSVATAHASSSSYNFVSIHVAGGVATATAYNDTGTQLDSFTVTQNVPNTGGGSDGGTAGGGDDAGAGGGGSDAGAGGGGGGGGGNGEMPMNGSGGGCAMSGAGPASTSFAFAGLLFVAGLLRRRRRLR